MAITKLEETIVKEIEEQRPPFPVGLLSRREKDLLIERGLVGLYRWYTDRSQTTRNWSADTSFDWRAFRTDHSPEMNTLLEGFFAIEQFVVDYTIKTIQEVRESYGRSHFQIRWGAEEERHSDVWLTSCSSRATAHQNGLRITFTPCALERGVKRSRLVPDDDGNLRETAFFDSLDYDKVEADVKKIFGRVQRYEQGIGLDEVYPTHFVPSGLKEYISNQP